MTPSIVTDPRYIPLYYGMAQAIERQKGGIRLDSNETAFLERNLTFLRRQIETVDKLPRDARLLVTFANDIPATASTVAYQVNYEVARAKVTANAAGDGPRIDVASKEVTFKIHEITASYGWTVNGMAESARIGRDLSTDKALAAKSAIEDGIDEMLAFGRIDPQNSLACTGLINNADVITQGIINPGNDPWNVSSTAVDLIIADVTQVIDAVTVATAGKHKADTLLMAYPEFLALKNKRLGTNNDMTVLKYILENNPDLKSIVPWHLLSGAGAGGTTNRMIAYKRSPDILEGILPMEFQQLPPQAQGFEFVVNCQARCGGVLVKRPLGMVYADFTPTVTA